MKVMRRIVDCFFLALGGLIALVLAFIELRALFAGDFLLMNLKGAAFMGYLLRGLFFVIVLGYSICLIVTLAKKDATISISHYFVAPTILIASLFSIFFYSTYIYFLVIFIALIPCAVVLLRRPTV